MDRNPTSVLLSWILLPVAAYLALSAFSLPHRAYTGLAIRGDLVVTVDPGSPGDRAGLRPGDRLTAAPGQAGLRSRDPLLWVTPGVPITLTRIRGVESQPIWLAPEP